MLGAEGELGVDSSVILARFQRVVRDPFEFLKAVRTLDPADKINPIKTFPWQLPYVKYYVRVWERRTKIACPKSRRMKMSWLNIALHTWDAMFHKGRHEGFVSKKEDDSDELVKRAKFIVDHLDPAFIPRELIPQNEYTFTKLRFPELDSIVQGFPSGSDQLRQYTMSRLFFDEAAFWDDAEKAYSASLPTLEGGGSIAMVSSPAPGFFKKVVFDELDGGSGGLKENYSAPMDGLEIWQNEKNKFTVFQLHYKADPVKRKPGALDEIKSGMPIRKFQQEYELQWETFEGLSVYGDWDSSVHTVKGNIDPHIGLPLLLGFDFGLTPACIACQYRDGQLVVMKEFVQQNMGAERFMHWLIPLLKTSFPQWADHRRDYILYIDPSGEFRKDTDEGTCSQVIASFGFENITPGAISFEERRESVEFFLTRRTKEGPGILVSSPNCPVLTRGFQGGYRYDERVVGREPVKLRPIKDEHSHIHDALQMVCSRILMTNKIEDITIPRPDYSWARRQRV